VWRWLAVHKWDALWRVWTGRVLLFTAWTGVAGFLALALFRGRLWVALLLILGGAVPYFVVAQYLLPVVEIAPRGQSRFELIRSTVITIMVGLIGEGSAKLLFG
jgi:hypothetical protein